jgi:spoIIIJ-associated protein
VVVPAEVRQGLGEAPEDPVEEIERSGASVEEAIEAALNELGVSEQEARISIVQEPRTGFLGIASQPAIVRVSVAGGAGRLQEDDGEDRAALDEQADIGADFLEGLLDAMGLDADIEINEVDGATYVDVWAPEDGEDMGLLIGKGGHTLEALQEILRSHVQRRTGERCRVLVDVEDYRKRRRSHVVRKARDAARQVKRSGRPFALEPMSSYERKVVHDTVAEVGGLETASEGEEPARRVVIKPAGSAG